MGSCRAGRTKVRVAIATPVELPKNVGSRAVASELRLAERASCGTDVKPRSGLCRVERRSERIEAAVEAAVEA